MTYFPISANILTNGHLKCIKWLKKKDKVLIGLLTSKALKGYKKEIVPFKDRLDIMKVVADGLKVKVVPQDSLNPSENIKRYRPDAIASGDGWENCELDAIKRFHLKKININLPKEYSSSKIINKLCKYENTTIAK